MRLTFAILTAAGLGAAVAASADIIETEAGPMAVTPIVTGLNEPWGFDTLPDGGILITERAGSLLLVRDGRATRIDGLPDMAIGGQGGLLDVLVPSDHAQTGLIFFTFSKPGGLMGGSHTAAMRAKLNADQTALTDVEIIFEGADPSRSGRHFGSRLVEAPDGTLFVTIGDRGDPERAQDVGSHAGKIVRIAQDGSIPSDNPFLGKDGVLPEIYSWGHRNPQGAALDAKGQLWTAEHGAAGGDEINKIRRGINYGWPTISYGVNYNGSPIGEGTEKEGLAQPESFWDPSMAPSGMVFYDGDAIPDWQGDAFVGSLKFGYVARLSGTPLAEVERIQGVQTGRVRDVDVGPDGALWYLSVIDGALYSLAPAQGG